MKPDGSLVALIKPQLKDGTRMRIAVLPNPRAGCVRRSPASAAPEAGGRSPSGWEGDAFPSPNADALIRESDVTVALGGDGTIIHTAKRAAICGRAVLGDQRRPPRLHGGA